MNASATWVATDAALAGAAAAWASAPAVALDTEFVRTRTFYPRLGLIQVATADMVVLIDPLAVDLAPVAALLVAPGTLKVLHSASEDIEVLFHSLGVVPQPLFDTQVGGALMGCGAALSYQRLVAELLGVAVTKNETRTDWLARPLSDAQCAYAAEDVAHLLPLWGLLRQRLEEAGRLSWALADAASLLDTTRFSGDPRTAYRRIQGAGRLRPRQLAAVRELAAWRDGEARRRDLPRGFVLRDELLLRLATRLPQTAEELSDLPGAELGLIRRDGEAWLAGVRRALQLPESELPARPWRPPDSAAAHELSQRLRDRLRELAAALALAPETLASRRTLDRLLRNALTRLPGEPVELPEELDGWRRAVIGEPLLAALAPPG